MPVVSLKDVACLNYIERLIVGIKISYSQFTVFLGFQYTFVIDILVNQNVNVKRILEAKRYGKLSRIADTRNCPTCSDVTVIYVK